MIDKRVELPQGYLIKHQNHKSMYILRTVEKRALSIVYEAYLFDGMGIKHYVRVKELYPIYLELIREEDYTFSYSADIANKLISAKERFNEMYIQSVELRNIVGLENLKNDSTDIFEYNNTMYMVMSLCEGVDYGRYRESSLHEMFEYIKSVATIVKEFHDNGILYLNLKPENIFVILEPHQKIELLDFDSIIRKEELFDKKTIDVSYSEGYSAPEQVQGNIAAIGYHTDIYAIGALLFSRIYGRSPSIDDCRISSVYCFDNVDLGIRKHRPELCCKLSYFFHKTISIATKNRWSYMDKVIEELEEMIKLVEKDDF